MPDLPTYNPTAALKLLDAGALSGIAGRLTAARDEVVDDVELVNSGSAIPAEKKPLDAGFINLPRQLLDEYERNASSSLLGQIETVADELKQQVGRVVVLGIGGSYMGARALFEALCHPYHNDVAARLATPAIYFEGHNVDGGAIRGLLDLLVEGTNPSNRDDRWAIVVISKSGGTLETAVAFRVFRQAIEDFYGADSDNAKRMVVAITGEEDSKLREIAADRGYADDHLFPVPDGVGGRFSVLSAVGLLPAALMGIDVRKLLEGAAAMTDAFRTSPVGGNPAVDYTGVCHLFEEQKGATIRVLSTWGSRLEALGLWYDQLLAESLGKQRDDGTGVGATPITGVNTRDLHSRGQQHQEGRRDKLITNIFVQNEGDSPVSIPTVPKSLDRDNLNQLEGKTTADVLAAAFKGTNDAYAAEDRPTADILLPRLDAFTIGAVLQMFMLATATEGRLIGVNPYGQPGVEAYKKNMQSNLGMS